MFDMGNCRLSSASASAVAMTPEAFLLLFWFFPSLPIHRLSDFSEYLLQGMSTGYRVPIHQAGTDNHCPHSQAGHNLGQVIKRKNTTSSLHVAQVGPARLDSHLGLKLL